MATITPIRHSRERLICLFSYLLEAAITRSIHFSTLLRINNLLKLYSFFEIFCFSVFANLIDCQEERFADDTDGREEYQSVEH